MSGLISQGSAEILPGCYSCVGCEFNRPVMSHSAPFTHLETKPQNAFFPPQLEIPVHASVPWASRQATWHTLQAEDSAQREHAEVHPSWSVLYSSFLRCLTITTLLDLSSPDVPKAKPLLQSLCHCSSGPALCRMSYSFFGLETAGPSWVGRVAISFVVCL